MNDLDSDTISEICASLHPDDDTTDSTNPTSGQTGTDINPAAPASMHSSEINNENEWPKVFPGFCPACKKNKRKSRLQVNHHPQDHKGSAGKIRVWHCHYEHDAVRVKS